MGFDIGFNASGIDPQQAFEALPAGDYPVLVSRVEVKQTKAGSGQYLEVELDVQSDAHRGRKLFDRINLWNANPKTVEIAQRQLSGLCHATGELNLANTDQLLGKVAIATINAKDNPPYGVRNEVRAYKAPDGAQQPHQAAPAAPRAQAPAAPRAAQPPFGQAPAAAAPAQRAPWAA